MIKDKITQAIAEAAMGIISETWPDAASTSIYVDKADTTPISNVETPESHTMTDEATTLKVGSRVKVVSGSGLDSGKEGVIVDRSNVKTDGRGVPMNLSGNYKPIDWSKEVLIKQDDGKMFSMFKNRVVPIEESIEISEEEITEALKASQPASEWIHDFVNSNDAKFKGKTKAERINMALGAYYAAQRSVKEGVEEPRAEGEKRFKAAHVINRVHDVNQDKQTGTESMDSKSKPALPMGTSPTKPEHYDEMEQVEQDVKDIKSSISKQAKAPEAKSTKQAGAESAESLKDTTKGGTQNAAAPKATGSKQSGTESAEKVKDTAPSGKLNAEAPKATGTTHKGAESMPKGLTGPGLKESAIVILLGEDAVNASKHVKHAKATKPVADKIKKVLSKGTSKYHETVKEETLDEDVMIDEGLFDTVKALGKNVVKKVGDTVAGKVEAGIQSVVGAAPTAKPAITGAKGNDDTEFKKKAASLVDSITTADQALAKMKKDNANPQDIKDLEKRKRVYQLEYQLLNRQHAGDSAEKLKPIQKELQQLQSANSIASTKSAATGAATLAQKAAQSKLAKQSTKQLQATMSRIQALLKQRGVTEDVSFNEAFEILGEDLIKECMSNFDKQYADDHEKELKQILSGRGTDGIDSRLQPELQKFITSYGDGLKKYLGIQVEEDSKGWDGTAEVSAKHAENTNGAVKESAEVETDQGDTTVPQNALVDALKDLAEVIERCEGVVPRHADFKNTHLFMKVQKAHTLLADVCEELENIEG